MKRLFSLAIAFLSVIAGAQDYRIDFVVYGNTGISADSILVKNLDQGHMLTLGGQDILHLVASTTGIDDLNTKDAAVDIYPNPLMHKAFISFPVNRNGFVQLSIYDMSGRLVTEKKQFQSQGKAVAEVGGLPSGAYVVTIKTESSKFSEVLLSYGEAGNSPVISFSGSSKMQGSTCSELRSSKKTGGLVDMVFDEGDTLSFTAYLDDQQTETGIVPIVSTTLWLDFQQDREFIVSRDTITPEGGVLQVLDERGNSISVTFPPGAVSDTTLVSLAIPDLCKNLPVSERQLRSFEIEPRDIELYLPATISITYNSDPEELEKRTLFHVESEKWLLPLSDHSCDEGTMTLTALTYDFGELAEGKLTPEQLNKQFDLLLTELEISWEAGPEAGRMKKNISEVDEKYKNTWQGWRKMAGGFISLFYMKEMYGLYDEGENKREDDQEQLCEKVLNEGVKQVLNMPLPEDLCNKDYSFTLASMVHDMEIMGCQGTSEYSRLNERFNQTLINCSSYLEINMNLNIQANGFSMLTSGVVPITTTRHFSDNATVVGSGVLAVSGSASAGGPCSGSIDGETEVDVNGSRNGAYSYSLTLNTYQTAVLITTCPGQPPTQTPLNGEGIQEVTLSLANNFSYSHEEPVEGGTFMIDVVLVNPFVSLPSED